jgi:hypothetical protein
MKSILTLVICLLYAAGLTSQNCEVYIPYEEGTEQTYVNFNAKGKKESTIHQKLVSKKDEKGATIFTIHQVLEPVKGDKTENNFSYKCTGDRFIIDMNSFINDQQKASMGDAKLDITFDEIDIPAGAKPGMKLKDGNVIMSMISDAPIKMNLKIYITERVIESIETITTPAGTFECIKISQTILSDMGIVKMTVKSTEWLAKKVGVVKSETYSKAGKLMGYMELQSVRK